MAGKSDYLENGILALLYQNQALAEIGNTAGLQGSSGVGSPGSLHFSLHSVALTDSDNQAANEVAYTSYARAAVARSSGEFTVAAGGVSNNNDILWPQCTGGSDTAVGWGVGTAASGTGFLLGMATMTSLAISNGIRPKIVAGTTIHGED